MFYHLPLQETAVFFFCKLCWTWRKCSLTSNFLAQSCSLLCNWETCEKCFSSFRSWMCELHCRQWCMHRVRHHSRRLSSRLLLRVYIFLVLIENPILTGRLTSMVWNIANNFEANPGPNTSDFCNTECSVPASGVRDLRRIITAGSWGNKTTRLCCGKHLGLA